MPFYLFLAILRRMTEHKSPALSSMGLFYLGDELMHFPMDHDLHARLAWVYHQMWRPDLRRGISPNFQVCVCVCVCLLGEGVGCRCVVELVGVQV